LLWDALGLGIKALTISANTQTGEDEKIEGPMLYVTMFISLAFSIGLFFLLPYGAGELAQRLVFGAPAVASAASNAAQLTFQFTPEVLVAAAAEGIVRLLLIVGYMW